MCICIAGHVAYCSHILMDRCLGTQPSDSSPAQLNNILQPDSYLDSFPPAVSLKEVVLPRCGCSKRNRHQQIVIHRLGYRPATDLYVCSFLYFTYVCWDALVGGVGFVVQYGGRMHVSKVYLLDFHIFVCSTSCQSFLNPWYCMLTPSWCICFILRRPKRRAVKNIQSCNEMSSRYVVVT